MEKCCLFLLACLVSACVTAQDIVHYKFDHFTPKAGLSSIYARKIVQDPFGFIWVGTIDGLNRYNGKSFSNYNKDIPGKHALTGSDIRDLLIDTASTSMWAVNSYGGIDQINYVTGNVVYRYFQSRDQYMKDILLSSLVLYKRKLYVGSSAGLFVMDIPSRRLQKITIPLWDTAVHQPTVNDLHLDENSNLWVFCEGKGVSILNVDEGRILGRWSVGSSAPGIRYYDVCKLADRSFLAATSVGLLRYRTKSRGNGLNIEVSTFHNLRQGATPEIYACAQDNSGAIWFSQSNALLKIANGDKHPVQVKENISRADPDWLGAVYSIYFGAGNDVWLGCQQGLAVAQLKPVAFLRYSASPTSAAKIGHAYYLYPCHDSLLYCCAQDGLYKINFKSGDVTTLHDKKSFYHFFEDPKGKKIAANIDGSFVLQGNKLVPLEEIYPIFKSLGKIILNSHCRVGDSLIIFGTENHRGIIVWNYKRNKVVNITQNSPIDRLKENTVNGLFKDRKNRLWILGDHSISLLDLKTFTLSWMLPANNADQRYFSIFFDACEVRGRYYIACYGSGVVVLDSDLNFEKQLTVADGLSANSVYKLLPWRDSLLFVTSNNGISQINLATPTTIYHYNESDGLHGNEFEENSGSAYTQYLFAGGAHGITRIEPKLLSNASLPGKTFVDNIRIETSTGRTDTSDLLLRRVILPSDVLQTTLYFSNTDFTHSANIRFAYRIKEIGDEWIELGSQNFTTLIGLSPGDYHLEIASGQHNFPNLRSTTSLLLTVLPKWHQTFWFKALLVLTSLALGYAFYRYRVLQLKKQQQIRKDIASDLHDDIGSTLNSVKIFAHLAKSMPNAQEYLTKIEDSLQQTSTRLRDIIWVLDDSADTPQDLMERLKAFALPLCMAKGIELRCQLEVAVQDTILAKAEKRNLLLIGKESVNNAIKYADCTAIDICIELQKQAKKILISDNGHGFDIPNTLEGNGLKNMQYRATQMGYFFSVLSTASGTTVSLFKQM